MKKIINGKTYNTETAHRICLLPFPVEGGFLNGLGNEEHSTTLYLTKKGDYFLEGYGGAATMWARSIGNAKIWGGGIRAIDANEAMVHAKSAKLRPEEMLEAGFEIQEA